MARARAPEATEPAEPTEPAPEAPEAPEAQVPPSGEAGPAEAVAQEPEKPDLRAAFADLPKEEQEAILKEAPWFQEQIRAAEESAASRAYNRYMGDLQRQAKANEGLQTALRNLESAMDDNQRAGVVQGFAQAVLNEYVPQRDQEWRDYFDQTLQGAFGLSVGDYRAAWIDVHRDAAKQNRTAQYADFVKHMMGERFMPKQQMTKEHREEIAALVEEAVGKRIAGQPAPVGLGPGESADRRTFTRSQIAAMTREEYTANEAAIKEAMFAGRIKDE